MFRKMRWLLAAGGWLVPLLTVAEMPLSDFMSVDIQERNTGTFYIAGAIEGVGDLDMLVDTGSSYVVINDTMLEMLKTAGRAHYSRNLEGRMADGATRIIPLYRLAALRLGEECWLYDVEAAVFPAGSRPILGMNALSRLAPFTLSAHPAQLGLSHCGKPLPPPAAGEAVKVEPEEAPLAAATRPSRP
jgi:clan AA aspartic protease (TIGR02281 family)